MKAFFKILFVLVMLVLPSCATHPKVQPVASQQTPISEGVPPSPTPASEIKPFYEAPRTEGTEEPPKDVVENVIGEEAEEEIEKSGPPQFDIPIVVNKMVEKWINYFQNNGRKVFGNWMVRSGKYIPMMKKILRENGLPEDLVYLAMIESGFKPYAYSPAKASGPWQFIKGTGLRYGLRVTWWIDERRDPEKSSLAAAQHLKDLYDQFNSWYLAAAGYNAGAGKISRAMAKYSTEDFWEMSRFRYLKSETKNYVPKMIAAALIAKEPEKYGFTGIEYEAPYVYEKTVVREPIQLDAVAAALKLDRQIIAELNPELRRSMTPPDVESYELKLPRGYKEVFESNFDAIRANSAATIVRHVSKRGETIAQIARRHGVQTETILSFNQLKNPRLKPGMQIAIPLRSGQTLQTAKMDPEDSVVRKVSIPAGRHKYIYNVRPKDTLWSISRQFNVSVSDIRAWNRLSNSSEIQAGKKIKIYTRSSPTFMTATPPEKESRKEQWRHHRVRQGETLWEIARHYGVSVSQLVGWNDLDSKQVQAGIRLKVRVVGL